MVIFAMMSLLEIPPSNFLPAAIRQLDYSLFSKLNGQWHTTFLDKTMPYIREPFIWVPFYFFLVLLVAINFKTKGLYWSLFLILTAMISDYTSSSIIKENFFRIRPCRDPSIAESVRFLVEYCPRSSSFTSSHAVNHFAAATFIFTTFRKTVSPHWAWVFAWAALICYAQVYVGVHFPLDVVVGAFIGMLIGYYPALFFNKKIGLLPLT